MPVITQDVTIHGLRRDTVFAWLGDPAHHERLLRGAFARVQPHGEGVYDLDLGLPAPGGSLTYEFTHTDDHHGGRRVHVRLTGRRAGGALHWSLRTTKPSTDTLVTLHVDYEPSSTVWKLADTLFVRKRLEDAWRRVLGNLPAALADLPRDL